MNKKIVVAIIIVLAVLATIGWWQFSNKTSKIFIASGHPEWPPIMWQQDGEIIGVGPDLVSRIFEDLGLGVDFKYLGLWDEVQNKARSGEADLLVAAYKTTERETYMDYSIPYVTDPIAVVIKKGKDLNYEQWADLVDKKGVATIGDSYGQQFDDYLAANLTVARVSSVPEALEMIQNDQADYFLYAFYAAEKIIAEKQLNDKVEILPKYIAEENFYITISKKSPLVKYLPQINELLEKYKNDGTTEKLIKNNKGLYLNQATQ